MNLKDVFKKFQELSDTLCLLFREIGYDENCDLSAVHYKSNGADDLFIVDQFQYILFDLECVLARLNYLNKPIKAIGVCKFNSNERYELRGVELTSGRIIEYYDADAGKWVLSTVENVTGSYMVVGSKVPLSSLFVRIR